jgi:hypothetical protein
MARKLRYPGRRGHGQQRQDHGQELIAAILGVSRSICVTQGNLNNDIGVPLTLMRLSAEHHALVAELGANHAGEIDYLAGLVQPTVGVITNAAAAHLEGFGSLAGVAAAKGELLDHLPKAAGGAQRRRSIPRADRARPCELTVTFDLPHADCTGSAALRHRQDFAMRLPTASRSVRRRPRRQNVANARAGPRRKRWARRRTSSGPRARGAVRGRLRAVAGAGRARVDDSYNATRAPCARRSTTSRAWRHAHLRARRHGGARPHGARPASRSANTRGKATCRHDSSAQAGDAFGPRAGVRASTRRTAPRLSRAA